MICLLFNFFVYFSAFTSIFFYFYFLLLRILVYCFVYCLLLRLSCFSDVLGQYLLALAVAGCCCLLLGQYEAKERVPRVGAAVIHGTIMRSSAREPCCHLLFVEYGICVRYAPNALFIMGNIQSTTLKFCP